MFISRTCLRPRPTGTGRRHSIISLLVAMACASALAMAPVASATGVLQTTTTVSANPAATTQGGSVTLTASVSLSVLVTPLGSVSFSATNGSTTVALGSAPLGNCSLLNVCTASITTTALPVGTDTVTATYAGDSLSGPSSGTTTVSVIPIATPANPYSQTCAAGTTCTTPVEYGSDLQESGQLAAGPSSTSNTLTLYLGGASEVCSTPNGGQPVNFASTATDVSKTTYYYVFDTAAQNIRAALAAHNEAVHVCYSSPTPFKGYSPKVGTWVGGYATSYKFGFVPKVGDHYAGLLGPCNNTNNSSNDGSVDDAGNNAPCYVSETYVTSGLPLGRTSAMRIVLIASPGDPRTTG